MTGTKKYQNKGEEEYKDILHESNVNIVDAYILHVDGEVGHYGEGGAVEEEESALQRKQVHIWPEG